MRCARPSHWASTRCEAKESPIRPTSAVTGELGADRSNRKIRTRATRAALYVESHGVPQVRSRSEAARTAQSVQTICGSNNTEIDWSIPDVHMLCSQRQGGTTTNLPSQSRGARGEECYAPIGPLRNEGLRYPLAFLFGTFVAVAAFVAEHLSLT